MAENSNDRQVQITGKLKWASLSEANKMSGKFQVDGSELSASDVKKLKGVGIEARDGADKEKPDPEAGMYITPKAGRMVTVVDTKLNPLSLPEIDSIGNGTTAQVSVRAYDYTYKGKSGVGAGLQGIKVTDMVEYSATSMFKPDETGYVASAAATADDVPF